MKRQLIKSLLVIMCMLAAGICYSCNRTNRWTSGDKQKIMLETEDVFQAETAGETKSEPAETPACYYVHICGEVNTPGVYQLEKGSRIFQAVAHAGGFTDQAAAEYLNMAQEIQDGMKIFVPSVEEVEAGVPVDQNQLSNDTKMEKVNLNTASKEQLMTLRGIGESKAKDILRYREEHGAFQNIEEIMEIPGIKDAAFQKIKDDITV